MSREVPVEGNTFCDNCGQFGNCFDFMGDFLCAQCADRLIKDDGESRDIEESD